MSNMLSNQHKNRTSKPYTIYSERWASEYLACSM